MSLSPQKPAPVLMTGHSPPFQGRRKAPARFASLTPNATTQFISATLGVWAPKVPITRSKTQFFEDGFLELVEGGAFYFTLPVIGPLLGKGLSRLVFKQKKLHEDAEVLALKESLKLAKVKDVIGIPMQDLSKEIDKLGLSRQVAEKLIATKAAALIGTVAIAAGFEYMIQHTKNVITAKGFKTKNFAAVAGLEESKARTQSGLIDPVAKAKKRAKQVGVFLTGALSLAVLTPMIMRNRLGLLNKAESFMKVVDCTKNFDISKPILAFLIGTGVVSYLDAARDPLEKKETGTRLCVVVPYLMFGKELTGYAIAKLMERFKKIEVDNDAKKPMGELVRFVEDNPFQKMFRKKSLLQTKVVIEEKELIKKLETLPIVKNIQSQDKPLLAAEVKAALLKQYTRLGVYSTLVSALGCGTLLNWIIYKQTQARYKHQQELLKTQTGVQIPSGDALPPTVGYGNPTGNVASFTGQARFKQAN
jgi:hypothetical protein